MDMGNQSMYNHNKAQQSKNRVHISWGILYTQLSLAISQNKHLISPNIFLTAECSKYNKPDDDHDKNVNGIK